MKKSRKKLKKRRSKSKSKKRNLRSGSKAIKKILLAANPHCDICGTDKSLQLHHVYFIRHGFKSELNHCVLLCANCHLEFHKKYDDYLDRIFNENPRADFLDIYNTLKNQ